MNVIWKFLAVLWWFWTHRVSTLSSEIIHCKNLLRVAAVAFGWWFHVILFLCKRAVTLPTHLWVWVWMVKNTLPYGQVFQKSQETTVHHMCVRFLGVGVSFVSYIFHQPKDQHIQCLVIRLEDVNKCKQEAIQTLKSKYSKYVYIYM